LTVSFTPPILITFESVLLLLPIYIFLAFSPISKFPSTSVSILLTFNFPINVSPFTLFLIKYFCSKLAIVVFFNTLISFVFCVILLLIVVILVVLLTSYVFKFDTSVCNVYILVWSVFCLLVNN